MEQYKRHRKVLQTAFSKIGNELEQLLTAERTDLQDIQVHWDLLEDKYGSLQDINKNVFDSLLESDAPEEELGAKMESCDGYMKRFKLLKYKYEQLRGTTESINEERAPIVSRPASNVSGITAEGFGLCSKENRWKRAKPRTLGMNQDQESNIPSAASLMNSEAAKCIFCEGTHDSHSCFEAQNYTLEQKRGTVTRKKACYRCLRTGHPSRKCRQRVRCLIYKRSHVALMCPDLPENKSNSTQQPAVNEEENENEMVTTAKGTLLRPIQHIYPLECIDATPVIDNLQPDEKSFPESCEDKQEDRPFPNT
ncbi:hypothetical protein JTB14_003498 [Gonioctena quinquepunctata]|nr:hypothetical protein JTB14_003498 [Gonioctena quinquepunctata]